MNAIVGALVNRSEHVPLFQSRPFGVALLIAGIDDRGPLL